MAEHPIQVPSARLLDAKHGHGAGLVLPRVSHVQHVWRIPVDLRIAGQVGDLPPAKSLTVM